MTQRNSTSTEERRPLSVWELPKLATLVHSYRQSTPRPPRMRPHFPAILAFVYRNRLAVASQIQRRFPEYLPSDRTTRRHLAEMESLGLLGVQAVTGVSPLMPKPYFVTQTGLRHLRRAYEQQGRCWEPYLRDRRRSQGQSFPHVWHELATTEFLLALHETVHDRPDLELPVVERRSLVRHPAFALTSGRQAFLRPDGLFVFSHRRAGKMCCLLEIDTGSEGETKLLRKLHAYRDWMTSPRASRYLIDLYHRSGAKRPRSVFRLLFVVCTSAAATNQKRRRFIHELLCTRFPSLAERTWITSADAFACSDDESELLGRPVWIRVANRRGAQPIPGDLSQLASCHPLFPPAA